ncbi:CCA tRNA nucleotidyltransferase [Aliarcobacter butzleri]|uniref:CCA tRNA nucleotidyltransferase n=1 Tax=Aliarcobacter butzleri TaxID=28197 RepID=A0AAP4PYN3_9BACT|nr:CCA tRNA nucleotidyltransferase [Aliarcobacter butzleri]MDK2090621.1 CCA tRNA nucleotidyltransferase [Aliarcobacter butzleri]MDN5052052.1 CCA tRNA nucleotidyltransferase [Aliarcobacter butzleri]MDN5076129.1 CCA tRNA nucleotidyltransferase [Aliarcobacter butzleri]MDN5116384.1 CCA tRNA nucleotidyltransferase [Aliarcobacter butzleri]MDN5132242.1 CCA tRNA nucleotidyltransferase [Aliarcobacter butzleri]
MLVGGCVRDSFLNKKIKDYDVEIFNFDSLEILEKSLKKFGNVNLVGKIFGVLTLKIDEYDFDFSLPRIEKKTGNSHTDFEVSTNANLSFKEAAIRRDFTINAIGYDYFKNEILDPFGGMNDLKNKIIKHIDDKTFVEDSLRVYRSVQFASRFEFKIDENTKILCKKIVSSGELKFLPKERVFEELKKLFLKSKKPSLGLSLLKEFNIMNIEQNLEEIDNLAFILKDKNYDDFRKLYLFYSCLCKSMNEDETFSYIKNLTDDKKFIKNILILNETNLTNDIKILKRLSLKLKLEDLIVLNQAFKNQILLEVFEILKNLDILNSPIKPLVLGKDLIKLGFVPSEKFKEILDFAFNLQIEDNLSKSNIIEKIKQQYKF